MRVKLNYNDLLQRIDDVLCRSESEIAEENAFGISVGLQLLSCYLKNIAERAIELDDEVLIGLLTDLCVLKTEKEE